MRFGNRMLSENRPIRRNLDEKKKQLKELRDVLEHMKPHTSLALKNSIRRRISELSTDILSSSQKRPDDSVKTSQHKIYALYAD
ncbi:hypothetical protein GT348_02265 [Aristophania vespae]|uniref:Uncharacterized protein n=1 Tax=Aristophania vespae TaxID=2697033 RepID=A0A6P1NFM5_9PROT|nr:hypothetical protein [Aristophania vespae]QHI95254.1 hypothetical protein GT348_02265 [Aristophania vespae]